MTQTIEALFDGKVLFPDEPLSVEPNTRVRLTVEVIPSTQNRARSFLQTARSLKLHGPPDWASNLDHYLYGEGKEENG